ncbi:hypothetical protein [Methylobacterium sp. Leaf85]|uniref:hypothetical protein n=1 Tax=Methylobacterium sp. Leaf85 TaxID=1736241 RepID=UPI0006FA78BF|nr:hypothetical protein [Methylobacterium sp. Leaf85]KQO53229.1 hypothetical protein ASF08_18435 [Methylobacterium sp. Leaf85]
MMDWNARVQAVLDHFGARKRKFTVDESLKLIDSFAQKGATTKAEMQSYGSPDFVATILGHVTTAVHGKGKVPREGGWYQHAYASEAYIIDPGFAEAWVAAIPKRAC